MMEDIQVGPVLRGLSAVRAAGTPGAKTPRADGTPGAGAGRGGRAAVTPEAKTPEAGGTLRATRGPKSLGPGALYRYHDTAEVAMTEHGADKAGSVLTLPSIENIDTVVDAWMEHISRKSDEPDTVILPSGAAWVRTEIAPDRSARSSDVYSAEELGKTMEGRVVLVTGAAQGFGLQIARGLAAIGGIVALADLNVTGAREEASRLGSAHAAFEVNVTDEESVAALVAAVTRHYGGIDVVVSNAGVLKAGSVKELTLKDFRFVTDVNYIGFFLMTKHTAPILEYQYLAAGRAQKGQANGEGETGLSTSSSAYPAPYLTDIIEINSKSGLVGSNKNGAYAGSKFGGLGLVQSFALELVEQGTKVNAICPGNYLDGPLWSDPERGLFVQYLRAGKVPGARTIDDVRHFYEQKVPMKRGCTGGDVVRAVAYVVGQEYETGQAVPVTGGQVMLS